MLRENFDPQISHNSDQARSQNFAKGGAQVLLFCNRQVTYFSLFCAISYIQYSEYMALLDTADLRGSIISRLCIT